MTAQTPQPPSDDANPTFVRPKALARKAGVCPRTLKRWATAGLIHKFVVNPRVVLFDEREVMRFIASTRVP